MLSPLLENDKIKNNTNLKEKEMPIIRKQDPLQSYLMQEFLFRKRASYLMPSEAKMYRPLWQS